MFSVRKFNETLKIAASRDFPCHLKLASIRTTNSSFHTNSLLMALVLETALLCLEGRDFSDFLSLH